MLDLTAPLSLLLSRAPRMPGRLLWLPLAIVASGSLALPRSSFAAEDSAAARDTAVAREHAQKGKAFIDLGKYTEAATEYEAAYAAKPDPALLLNLAQAYRLAGNADRALFFYRKYLQHVPKSPYRADIEDKIAALEKQVKEPRTGAATGAATAPASSGALAPPPPSESVSAPPPHPAAPIGNLPPGPPGAPAPGPFAGAPPNPQDINPVSAPSGMPPPAEPTSTSTSAPPSAEHGRTLKLAGLVTGGVGVVSIVVGAVFGAQAKNAADKIEAAAARSEVYTPDLQSQDSRGRSAQAKEAVFLVIGAAAVVGGGVLYYLGARQQKMAEAGTVAILPAASASQLGAAMLVTF
jgi:tetratricopeptide (TPR) repeat protein